MVRLEPQELLVTRVPLALRASPAQLALMAQLELQELLVTRAPRVLQE